ncbi:MAG: helix-turn-helix transcriptional regulator [Oscillospiraceae bacterium]|nr:helix-turn-helix transcriptional regulator [Oscillospiraceae bacterium]
MKLKLKELRSIKGVTQEQIAEKLYCTFQTYSKYENGHRNPPLETLVQLADYFDVTTDYILGRENISAQALTEYEKELIEAARKADDRARKDALDILKLNKVQGK